MRQNKSHTEVFFPAPASRPAAYIYYVQRRETVKRHRTHMLFGGRLSRTKQVLLRHYDCFSRANAYPSETGSKKKKDTCTHY